MSTNWLLDGWFSGEEADQILAYIDQENEREWDGPDPEGEDPEPAPVDPCGCLTQADGSIIRCLVCQWTEEFNHDLATRCMCHDPRNKYLFPCPWCERQAEEKMEGLGETPALSA